MKVNKKIISILVIAILGVSTSKLVISNKYLDSKVNLMCSGNIIKEVVDIKSEMDINSNTIGQLKNKESIEIKSLIYDNNSTWCEVEFEGNKGYISEDDIRYIYSNSLNKNKIRVGKTNLIIREKPISTAKILGKFKKEQKFEIISLEDGWYKVNTEEGVGYINSSYVNVLK